MTTPLVALPGAVGPGAIRNPPLIAVTSVSATTPAPAALGASPLKVVGAYIVAWRLSAHCCPLPASAILLDRLVGQDPPRIVGLENNSHNAVYLFAKTLVLPALASTGTT